MFQTRFNKYIEPNLANFETYQIDVEEIFL